MEQLQDSSESMQLFGIFRRIDTAISSTNFDSLKCGSGKNYKLPFMRWL